MQWRCERLSNGFVRVEDHGSGLVWLLERDGRTRSGSGRLPVWVRETVRQVAEHGQTTYV